jgi:hypothetical protein
MLVLFVKFTRNLDNHWSWNIAMNYVYRCSRYGIKDVPGLGGVDDSAYDYLEGIRMLHSMGISIKGVKDAIAKKGIPVNLRDGHRNQSTSFGGMLRLK